MITIKSEKEIEKMKEAGKMLAFVHNEIANFIKAGLSTYEIDQFALRVIKKIHGTPSFFHLYDFPGNFCISINDEVIHGIPSKDKIIMDGDLVKIDGGVCYQGYHSDAARTHCIGNVAKNHLLLAERTKNSFFESLKVVKPGNHIGDIGAAIEDYISQFGYGIVDEYSGHGIGQEVHEDPEINNFKTKIRGPIIKERMTLAIEPMINEGTKDVFVDEDDDWTVFTADGSYSSHYENTVLVTSNGPEILTLEQ